MSQQNIDFGSFPDDPSADAIRTAFSKVQNNFDQLFDAGANAAVTSVNQTAGAGITVSSPTGNVVVSANIACVQVRTSTLSVGIGSNGNLSANYTSSGQLLYVDLPTNIQTTGNIQANGFIASNSNISASGNIAGGNLSTGGSLSVTGSANIGGNSDVGGNLVVGGSIVGNITGSASTAGTVTTNAQPNITSVGALNGLSISGDIIPTANVTYDLGNTTNAFRDLYLSGTTIYIGNSTITANASGVTIATPGGSTVPLKAGGSNTQIQYNDDGAFGGHPGMTFNEGTSTLTANNLVATSTANLGAVGNVRITGGTANYVLATNGSGNLSWVAQASGITGVSVQEEGTNVVATANTINFVGNGVTASNVGGVATVTISGSGTPGGSNTQIQYNDDGVFGGNSGFTFDETVGELNVPGNVVVGNAVGGNLTGANVVFSNSFTSNGGIVDFATNNPNVKLGNVGNVHIDGGTANYVLITDGSGNLSWANIAGGGAGNTAGGANTQVQYNDNGILGGHPGMTYDEGISRLTANNFVATSTANLGDAGNVTITGGNANFVLTTDGTGNLSWAEASTGNANVAGSNTQVQFNDDGVMGADANLTFDKTNGNLTVGSNVVAVNFIGSGANTPTILSGTNLDLIANSGVRVPSNISLYGPNVSLGDVVNLHITGGNANYVLTTDGSGNLSWADGSGGGGEPAGNIYEVQFNNGNSEFGASPDYIYKNGGLFVVRPGAGFPGTYGNTNANGFINASDELRVGIWGGSANYENDFWGRFRPGYPSNKSAPYYGFVGDPDVNPITEHPQGTIVITNEENELNQAIVLMDALVYNDPMFPTATNEGTLFGVSVLNYDANLGSGNATTGNEEGWKKILDLTNKGNLKVGGSFVVSPEFQFSTTRPANNEVGIYFADGTFQFTAASGQAISVQEEGNNVVTNANVLNFVGSSVTASNVAGVATITIANSGISGIRVQEEGTNVVSTANTINFVGNGVTASNVGGIATITIDSGNGVPAGNITEIQFNNGNSEFGAVSNLTFTANSGLVSVGLIRGARDTYIEQVGNSAFTAKWANYYDGTVWSNSAQGEAWLNGDNNASASFVLIDNEERVRYGEAQVDMAYEAHPFVTFKPDQFVTSVRMENKPVTANAWANIANIGYGDGARQTVIAFCDDIGIRNPMAINSGVPYGNETVTTNPALWPSWFRVPNAEEQLEAENDQPIFRSYNPAFAYVYGALPQVQGGALQIYHPRRDSMVHITGNTIIGVDNVYHWASNAYWTEPPDGAGPQGNLQGDLRLQGYGNGNVIISKNDYRDDWNPNNNANTWPGAYNYSNIWNYETGEHNGEQNNLLIEYGNIVIQTVPNVANSTLGIRFADNTFQYTAATGTAIAIQEEGTNVVASANTINFVGNGVTASNVGGVATVTIAGGGTPGGLDTQLQYNSNGVFGGIPNVTYSNGNLSLGNVANVKMTGGTNGYYLQTDGSGNLTWATGSNYSGNGTVAGANTQIQFNDEGNFGAVAGFTFDKTTSVFTANNIVATSTADLGDVANVTILGGNTNYILTTDGAGSLSWANLSSNTFANSIAAGGTNTQIQYNDDGVLGGNSMFTFDEVLTLVTANNLTVSSISNLGDVGNVHIDGGSNNYILTTDGSGNLSWANLASNTFANSIAAAGANTQVQYNDDGVLGGNPMFTFDEGLTLLTANNFAATSTANLGDVANVYIGGGNALDVLSTSDGNGTLAWATLTFMEAAGANTQVQYNDDGVLGGNPAFTFDESNTLITANNLTVSSITNLGNVVNVHIDGGTANYILTTDGNGNLSWSNGSSIIDVAAAGANTQIQYNDDGVLGGNPTFTFDELLSLVTVNNFAVTSTANLGAVGNVTITGGTVGQVLSTDGNGILSWSNVTSGITGIAVQEEGTNVIASANTINFVGNGVTASNVGGVATITIDSGGISGIDILYNTSPVTANATAINFVGPLANVANVGFGNATDVTIGLTVQDESNVVTGNASIGTLNFLGAGVTATAGASGIANITIPGASITVQDEGSNVITNATIINFVGNGVTSSDVGGVATVTIEGSGEVANANYANFAGTAFSVSGSNVSGEVANANYATFAGTAYSVDGANINGEVANANYATFAGTAYSVDGANVNGEVANANYATFAGTANTANTSDSANTININSMLGNTYYITGALNTFGSQTIHATSLFSYDSNTNTLFAANANIGNVYGIIRPTSGTGTNGIIFPADPGGGTGDLATIQYYAATGENTVLELAVTNDPADIIKLNATGGTTVTNTLTADALVTVGNATIGNHLTVTTGGATITGNLDVTGNLNVTGNLTYQNIVDLVVDDPLIYLAANNTGNLYDLGFVASFVDSYYQHTGFARDHNTGIWRLFTGLVPEPTTTIDWANSVYAPFAAGSITSDANINATGNVSGNNLSAGNDITAGGNVSGEALLGNTLYVTNDANVGNLGTGGFIIANGNITGSQLISTVATGTAPLVVTSTTRVANLNVGYANVADFINVNTVTTGTFYPILANALSGNVEESANANLTFNAATGALSATLLTGTLTTNAQPNITSVGTLTGLNVSGNVSFTGSNVSLGAVGNLHITGGSNNYILTTDGSGNLRWGDGNTISNVKAGGIDTQIQYNDNGILGGNPGMTFNEGTTTLSANNFVASSTANLGSISNVYIGGGTPLQILATIDGAGNLAWATIETDNAAGSDTQVQYNDNGILGGNPGFTFNEANTTVTANNFVATSRANLGAVGNVYIGGGNNGEILTTDGNGVLSWSNTITTTGNVTVGNIIASGYHIRSVATGITATGDTQANAFALTKEFNLVTTVTYPYNLGVVLPPAVPGMAITVINKGSYELSVYPAVNAAINSASANAAYSQPVNGTIQYIALTTSQWYTVGGTYA